jgi:hypothetical protein
MEIPKKYYIFITNYLQRLLNMDTLQIHCTVPDNWQLRRRLQHSATIKRIKTYSLAHFSPNHFDFYHHHFQKKKKTKNPNMYHFALT